jgi:hypothetical protein
LTHPSLAFFDNSLPGVFTMKLSSLALQWATTLSLLGTVAADPRVKLGYATYEGTSLNNGVNQFLGMRYAAPPLGDNRFRRAKEPIREKHVIQAKEVRSSLQCSLF